MIGILVALLGGIGAGIFFRNDFLILNSDKIVNLGLCLLLFFVGLDIGRSSEIFQRIKKFGRIVWFLPISTIIGSLLGGFLASFFMSISAGEGISIGAGLGWYSLSAIELAKISTELGSLCLLTNVLREIISIITVPFISKYIGSFESISVAGATAMDTLLPVINKHNSPDIAVMAFFSGVVLTGVIPFLLSLCIFIFNL